MSEFFIFYKNISILFLMGVAWGILSLVGVFTELRTELFFIFFKYDNNYNFRIQI
jgi:hypothetical protein